MQVSITARHCEVPPSLRERAATILDRLGNYGPELVDGYVVFDVEGADQRAELRLRVASGEVLVARGEGPNHQTALDRAEAKLKRQLERVASRWRRNRRPEADAV